MVDYGSSTFDWTGTQPRSTGTNVSTTRGSQPSGTPRKSNPNTLNNIGVGMESLSQVAGGINALSTAKFNAGLKREEGRQAFKTIIGDLHQAVGEYETVMASSGVRSQSAGDVRRAGISTGAKSAAMARYNANMEAANIEAAGREARDKAIMGAGQTMLSGWKK